MPNKSCDAILVRIRKLLFWELVDVSGAILCRYLTCSQLESLRYFTMFGAFPFYRSSCDLDRVRALAAQRARRAQWLPDEYDDDDDDDYRLHPHERAYLTAHRKHTQMERGQQRREQEEAEAARCRALEERKQQQELGKRQAEEQKRCRQQGLVFQTPIHPHTSLVADCNTPSNRKQYTEKHVEAASVLQRLFRIRQSIHTIQSLISEFNALRASFTYPSIVSFQSPSSSSAEVISVAAADPSSVPDDIDPSTRIPKLAFNSTNYGLLAYNDALDKLLVKLDGVESWGNPGVRRRRKNVVKQVEKEQGLVERFWKISWIYWDQGCLRD